MSAANKSYEILSGEKLMRPVIADVAGTIVHMYKPIIDAKSITTVFKHTGLDSQTNYIRTMLSYGNQIKPLSPEITEALDTITLHIMSVRDRIMRQYPTARRDGLTLTQTFCRHEAAIGIFRNYIRTVQNAGGLFQETHLVKAGLEAQKAIFIPDFS